MDNVRGLTDETTKCTEADGAPACSPHGAVLWEAEQKTTLTSPPTCATAAPLAPHGNGITQEQPYGKCFPAPQPLLCLPPALPTTSVHLLEQLRHLQREALAHSLVIPFLQPVQCKQKAKATFWPLVALCKPCAGLSPPLPCKANAKMSDEEFMQEEQRGCDKLNILLMFSVIFSHVGRRNAEELNQLG